jgi:ferritin
MISQELSFFQLETDLRKQIRDLVDPMMEQYNKGQELLKSLTKKVSAIDERVNLLEEAVIQKGEGSTIFDQIRDKFFAVESQRQVDNQAVTD